MNTELYNKIQSGCLLSAFALTSILMIAESGGAPLPPGRNVGIGSDAKGLYLALPGIGDATYDIDVKSTLTNTNWQRLGTLEAVEGENIYPLPSSSEPSRFFRLLFPQPTLAAAEPAFLSEPGDNAVYITGQFFYEGDLIRVGGVLLSNVTFLSSTTLTGTLPTQPDGIYDVEVISGYSGAVLATLHDAVLVSPPFELTVQEPPTWPPAGPAAALSSDNQMDNDCDDPHSSGRYLDSDDDGDSILTTEAAGASAMASQYGHIILDRGETGDMAISPGGGHVTVVKAHLDDDANGVFVPNRNKGIAPGAIAGIVIGAVIDAAIAPGGGHVTVIKSHLDEDSDGYGDTGVRLHSGEVQQQVADLAVAGRGLDFAWVRTYRSRTGQDSPQGTRWSHSYDVRCIQGGGVVYVYDGTGRKDTFRLQPDGSYTCPGFFREGTLDGNTFRLTFADTGFWEFNPFDAASPVSGKLTRIQDRNGNAITCNYDGAGRLLHVVDTLDQTNSVAYTPDDRVDSVTDSSGRTVTYAYYSSGESGGTPGDLKSVTSPPVTGTPNRNDFPNGKTTTFTYSTGQPDDRANHLLLTVTDALGQTTTTCSYDLNLASESFQRCVSLSRASEPAASLTYLPQTPAPGNGFAAMRCIVNDPVGNVTESFFDLRNRCVAFHQYTGRSQPGAPVTAAANRPEGKLRAGDPDRYESLRSWNNDSLCTRLTLPGGSTCRYIYAGDVNADTRARKRPDLLTQEWDAKATGGADINGDGSPDLFKIAHHYTHDPRFGSEPSRRGWDGTYKGKLYDHRDNNCDGVDDDCDGFVTSVTDPRGTVTTADYDDRGNLTRTTVNIDNGPVVDFGYNAYGQCTSITNAVDANGLRRVDTIQWSTHPLVVVCDAGQKALTTTYERDERGNVTRCIDPNGNDTLYTYNALDQLVACSSPPYGEQGGQRVTTSVFYDANNNVVQVDADNRRDTGGQVGSNPSWTTSFAYDALNRCVAVACELSPTASITNRFEYDANGQLTASLSPMAVSGAEPQNRVAYVYDERGLLFQETAAPGSSIAATREWTYTTDDSIASVRYADNSVALYAYDGFSRRSSATDANGNNENWFFNAAGDLTLCRVVGESHTLENVTANRRLSESSWSYDGLGRCTYQIDSFFDVFTEISIEDGARTTQFTYAPSGQRTSRVNDLGGTNRFVYDTAGRLASVMGPRGDTRVCVRDANGNVTRLTTSDVSDLGGNPQQFACDYTYDGLDRRISAVDNVGNTNRWFYDSRDLIVRTTDPRGNEIRTLYDGLSRPTGSISYVGPCDADGNGVDRGITINTSHVEYDANSRVTSLTDVNTNSTTYAYDTRDRLVLETCPDGTTRHLVWSPRSNLVQEEDACETIIDCIYDPLNRLIRKDVTPGSNVVASTTIETFAYDGLSRCIAASNDVSATSIVYDSLGNQIRCVTDGTPVLFTRNSLGDRTSLTYPSGITVSYTYDPLRQVKTVSMSSQGQTPDTLATYDYDGPGRLARITRIDGTTTEILWNGLVSSPNRAGDYGWQNVAAVSHGATEGRGGLIDERIFSYDRSQNKILRAQTEPFDPTAPTTTTNTWDYDALNRQRASATLGDVVVTRAYVLDGKGNRIAVTNNAVEERYVRSATIPPADFQVDQYTQTPSSVLQTYDANGRLTDHRNSIVQMSSRYDYADRLVQVDALGASGSFEPLISFGYDAFGRRISKTVYGSGIPPETTQYLYDGVDNDCDGETDDDDVLVTYVDGTQSGARIYGHGGGGGGGVIRLLSPPLVILNTAQGAPLFTRCDDLGNVLALTDSDGAVVERYAYSDFGKPQFLEPDGSPLTDPVGIPVTSSPLGNAYLFHGMQWDSETGLYLDQRQGRYVDPRSGQYTTRSDIGGEAHSRAFSDNSPWTLKNKQGGYRDGDDLILRKRPGRSSTRATDHNSSRSNKTSSSRATDHNSSRSNKTSSNIAPGGGDDRILRKRPGRVKYGNITLKRGMGRNPQLGREIRIAAKNVAKFKAGAALASNVN
jgi:YD repeat-containing protein